MLNQLLTILFGKFLKPLNDLFRKCECSTVPGRRVWVFGFKQNLIFLILSLQFTSSITINMNKFLIR